MIVELRDGLTEAQRDSIGATLAANKMTADVKFVSKDDKLADEEFRKAFAVDIEGLTLSRDFVFVHAEAEPARLARRFIDFARADF